MCIYICVCVCVCVHVVELQNLRKLQICMQKQEIYLKLPRTLQVIVLLCWSSLKFITIPTFDTTTIITVHINGATWNCVHRTICAHIIHIFMILLWYIHVHVWYHAWLWWSQKIALLYCEWQQIRLCMYILYIYSVYAGQ